MTTNTEKQSFLSKLFLFVFIHIGVCVIYLFEATEAHDDDGLPHTLEHLVFMGSEDYPYKVLCIYSYFNKC